VTEPIAAPAPEVAPAPVFVQPLPFFRRIVAFGIDGLVLGFVGQLAGLFL
jgi:hypothetical protein